MTFLKNIFGRIWAIWGILIFTATLFVVIIPICITFFIPEPKGSDIFRKITKIWMQVFLTLIGCRLIIKGKSNFKKGNTYIVVCNHNSFMDIPLTTPFIPGANKTIAKKSMAKIPVFGWIYTRGSVLVDRKSDESRRRSYEMMKHTLNMGLHMVIYPEGTRNRTNEPLKPFYDGAFKLAAETKKEIIPALLFNTRKVLPATKFFYLMPHKLEMHFLPPVPANNHTAKELNEAVHKIMREYYSAHNE